MSLRVLVVQSDSASAQELTRYFNQRGDKVWQSSDVNSAMTLITQVLPDLIILDLHLPGSGWAQVLRSARQACPDCKVIVTNSHPDLQREMLARDQGIKIFLRRPFTSEWIERALAKLNEDTQPVRKRAAAQADVQPRVRIPVRVKITFPYALLALFLAMAAAFIVSRVVFDSVQDRFTNQLIATGKQTTDLMVLIENRMLESQRLIANTDGVAEALQAGDAEKLRTLILPVAVNANLNAVELLDTTGVSVLSLHHADTANLGDYQATRGDGVFVEWDFVLKTLLGQVDQGRDKYAGMIRAAWGDYFYISQPVRNSSGEQVGVVLVGKTLSELVREMRQEVLADVTLYDTAGIPLASTLLDNAGFPLPETELRQVISQQDQSSLMRDLRVGSIDYSELVGPWEARGGQDLGEIGVSQAHYFLVRTSQVTRLQIFILVSIAFIMVVLIGLYLSSQITRPLLRVVTASQQVARGNLGVKVASEGNDEVAVLAHSFNYMVAGLQEGMVYHDLLGRTVSPEVREQLRQTFTSGNLRLEGQEAVATVLMSDIRGFTTLSERADPATVLNWLNEYFDQLVPIVTNNGGVVNKFDGDAMLAFFGILPRLASPKQSAYAACRTAVEMIRVIELINVQRLERGEPPLATGIGVNTGVVTAGGLGTSDRLHYTIIGDTVNTTQRMEALTRQLFPVSGVIISQATFNALSEYRSEFILEPLGMHSVKGKSEQVMIYRILPANKETLQPGKDAA